MATHLFERRHFLIRPRFQLLLASKAAGFLLLYSAAIIYASLRSVAETIYILPLDCLTPEVKARLWGFPTEALLLSVLIALVVVLQAILISHRVAGPSAVPGILIMTFSRCTVFHSRRASSIVSCVLCARYGDTSRLT